MPRYKGFLCLNGTDADLKRMHGKRIISLGPIDPKDPLIIRCYDADPSGLTPQERLRAELKYTMGANACVEYEECRSNGTVTLRCKPRRIDYKRGIKNAIMVKTTEGITYIGDYVADSGPDRKAKLLINVQRFPPRPQNIQATARLDRHSESVTVDVSNIGTVNRPMTREELIMMYFDGEQSKDNVGRVVLSAKIFNNNIIYESPVQKELLDTGRFEDDKKPQIPLTDITGEDHSDGQICVYELPGREMIIGRRLGQNSEKTRIVIGEAISLDISLLTEVPSTFADAIRKYQIQRAERLARDRELDTFYQNHFRLLTEVPARWLAEEMFYYGLMDKLE